MIKKISNEIEDFTNDIKDTQSCEKLLDYMNKDIYSSIKLLMSISKSFSIYGRVFMFFIISITGLIMLSTISIMPFNIAYLAFVDVVLFFLILRYVMYFKRFLFSKIDEKKKLINEVENNQ